MTMLGNFLSFPWYGILNVWKTITITVNAAIMRALWCSLEIFFLLKDRDNKQFPSLFPRFRKAAVPSNKCTRARHLPSGQPAH